MRDFLEYVEKMKEDSPTSLEFYLEGFAQDIMHLSEVGIGPVKSFILGFLSGKGIDLTQNKDKIISLMKYDGEIKNVGQSISSGLSIGKDDSNKDVVKLRKDLAAVLMELRKIIKENKENKEKIPK